jgi:hypothetical protein
MIERASAASIGHGTGGVSPRPAKWTAINPPHPPGGGRKQSPFQGAHDPQQAGMGRVAELRRAFWGDGADWRSMNSDSALV